MNFDYVHNFMLSPLVFFQVNHVYHRLMELKVKIKIRTNKTIIFGLIKLEQKQCIDRHNMQNIYFFFNKTI